MVSACVACGSWGGEGGEGCKDYMVACTRGGLYYRASMAWGDRRDLNYI